MVKEKGRGGNMAKKDDQREHKLSKFVNLIFLKKKKGEEVTSKNYNTMFAIWMEATWMFTKYSCLFLYFLNLSI